jgi:H+-translocating NAD(P) transhydrogenase subunit alpha
VLIGVPQGSKPGETRVAAAPTTVAALIGLGYDVVVESGAGGGADFSDEAFTEAGARVGTAEDARQADVVFRVNAPEIAEIARLRDGATLVSLISPGLNPERVEALAARPITMLAMDACRGFRGRSRWTC